MVAIATCIDWCTDGDDEALAKLPREVYVDLDDDVNDIELAISDYLSNTYGWLVNRFFIQ